VSRAGHCLTTRTAPAVPAPRPGVRTDPRMTVKIITTAAEAAGYTVTETDRPAAASPRHRSPRRLELDITTDPGGAYQFRAYFWFNEATGFWRWDRGYEGAGLRIFSVARLAERLAEAAAKPAAVP
jgi:hypothetical protein